MHWPKQIQEQVLEERRDHRRQFEIDFVEAGVFREILARVAEKVRDGSLDRRGFDAGNRPLSGSLPEPEPVFGVRGAVRSGRAQPELRAVFRALFPNQVRGTIHAVATLQLFLQRAVRPGRLLQDAANPRHYAGRQRGGRPAGRFRKPGLQGCEHGIRQEPRRLRRPAAETERPPASRERLPRAEGPMQGVEQDRQIRLPGIARADEHGERPHGDAGVHDRPEVLHGDAVLGVVGRPALVARHRHLTRREGRRGKSSTHAAAGRFPVHRAGAPVHGPRDGRSVIRRPSPVLSGPGRTAPRRRRGRGRPGSGRRAPRRRGRRGRVRRRAGPGAAARGPLRSWR